MAAIDHVAPEALPDEERLERRAKIAALEQFMLTDEAFQEHRIEPVTNHYFANGCYVREMIVPAGNVVIGKLHKTPHITVLVQGKITITTENGSQTIEAPLTLVSPPGVKRVGYCHTDVIWHSIHSVGEERDLDRIEAMLIAPSFDELDGAEPKPEIEEAA